MEPIPVFGITDEELEEYEGPWYCPHGVEVPCWGGACYHCAQEIATDATDGSW